MVSSLYSICLNYLKDHTEAISSLENIPFEPVVYSVLEHVFNRSLPLNINILSVCSSTFPHELRRLNTPWTRLVLSRAAMGLSALPSLRMISEKFPCFITCLQLGRSGLGDDDLYLLRTMTNLQVLDLGQNPNITDRGVSYLVNMATLASPYGMHHLEEVHLTDLPDLTDKCLKYIIKLNVSYLNLSRTGITEEVAVHFLTRRGGYRKLAPIPSLRAQALFAPGTNRKLHWFIKHISHIYDIGPLPLRPSDAPNKLIKKQRPTTTDYLTMFEKEIVDSNSCL
ncbi:hypothetical protein BD560DRAFT_380514 [Blakeslea trispora]|nr:hypothetical protein BD560DRAFT_380514 [Blakeslea trispora]